MFDLEFVGPNRWIARIDGTEYMLLVRPHVVQNETNDLIEVFLPCSVYAVPFDPGDPPIKIFHVKPGGQLVSHKEGGFMTGGPLTAIFRDDLIDLVNDHD
jgi:hypothetical protein